MLKLGKPKPREVYEDAGEVIDLTEDMVNESEELFRTGMDRNHRLGKVVKIFNEKRGYKRVLIEVHEYAKDNDGEWYVSNYDLAIGVKRKVFLDIVEQLNHGDMVMVGYYVQSFPSKEIKNDFVTLLKMRSIQVLRPSIVEAVGKSIWDASNHNPLGHLGKYIEE